ncbi:hypothetical protein SRDD_33550 [Serratia sp. DD3]|nr:hypothetical protein SRDD_33550 [Serratia sp. DD3]
MLRTSDVQVRESPCLNTELSAPVLEAANLHSDQPQAGIEP